MATRVEQVARLAPFQEDFLKDILHQATALKHVTQPFAPQQQAGFATGQQQAISQAMSGIGGYQPFLQAAQQYAAPTGAAQFFNPYENQVVQQTMQDIAQQGAQAQRRLGAQGVASGAFGGSRVGVPQAEFAGKTLEQQARCAGQLRQAGFTQAQQAAQRGAQLMAGLGQQTQAMGVQDINTLLGIGSLQQTQDQRALDIARANALAQQALPFQQVGFLSDIFRGVPSAQTTRTQTTSPTSPDVMTTGIGLLGAGLSGGFFN